jgi:hypothetical protein
MTHETRVGTLAIAKKDSAICSAGETGVCYDLYTLIPSGIALATRFAPLWFYGRDRCP